MAEDRIVETPTSHTTIIERRSGGGGVAIAVVLLLAVLIGGYFLFVHQGSESAKNNAITSAAKSVETTADKAGSAIDANK